MKKFSLLFLISLLSVNAYSQELDEDIIHFDNFDQHHYNYDVIQIKKSRGFIVVTPGSFCLSSTKKPVLVPVEQEIIDTEKVRIVGFKAAYKKAIAKFKKTNGRFCPSEVSYTSVFKYDSQSTEARSGYVDQYATIDFSSYENGSLYYTDYRGDLLPHTNSTEHYTTGIGFMAYESYRDFIKDFVEGRVDQFKF